MSKTGYLGNLPWFVRHAKGIWVNISKVTGQVERLQKRKATQRFTASLLCLSKPIPWFIINIPLSILLGEDGECSCDYKGKDSGDTLRGAETNFSPIKKESKMRQVYVDWDCTSGTRWSGGISFQHTDLTEIELHSDWEMQLLVIGLTYEWFHVCVYKSLEVKTDHITTAIYVIETTSQITLLASESVHLSWNWLKKSFQFEKGMIRISMIMRGSMKWSMRALFREILA